jgi:hypothetical protein
MKRVMRVLGVNGYIWLYMCLNVLEYDIMMETITATVAIVIL